MPDGNTSKAWRGLVDYANVPDLYSNPEALKSFATTLFDSMPWMARTAFGFGDVPGMIAQQANPDALQNAHEPNHPPWLYFKSGEELADQFRRQAVEYQLQVQQFLAWLSDRKRNANHRASAFAFMVEHMKHIEFHRGDPAFAPEEEQFRYFGLNDDFPYRTLFYKDLADVICDFVQREHEPGRDVPIRICKRSGCEKLVAQFKKRQYCGTELCDRARQERNDDVKIRKNRDSVFICRLRKMGTTMRRKKIRESHDRLQQIASFWQDRNLSLAKSASGFLEHG